MFDRNLKIFYRYAVDELTQRNLSQDPKSSIQYQSGDQITEKVISMDENFSLTKQESFLLASSDQERRNNPILKSFDFSSSHSQEKNKLA